MKGIEGVPTLDDGLHSNQSGHEQAKSLRIIVLNEVCPRRLSFVVMVSYLSEYVCSTENPKSCVSSHDSLASKFANSLEQVHQRGWRWSDCRPANICFHYTKGCLMALDWNSAVSLTTLLIFQVCETEDCGRRYLQDDGKLRRLFEETLNVGKSRSSYWANSEK